MARDFKTKPTFNGADIALSSEIATAVSDHENTKHASGVSLWYHDAGGDANAARPVGAASTDIVIWTNTPSEPTNMGVRDIWEDVS